MESRDNTLKVGLIVVAAVILAVIGYTVLQDIRSARNTEEYYADFDSVEGTTVGTPVRLRGNPIGKIAGFQLLGNKSRAIMRLDKTFNNEAVLLYPEFEFIIAQDDFFGEKYVNVVDPVPAISDAANQIANMLESVRSQLPSLRSWVYNSDSTAEGFAEAVDQISEDIDGWRSELASKGSELNRLAQIPLQRERWKQPLDSIDKSCAELSSLSDLIGQLDEDPELRPSVDTALASADESLQTARHSLVQADQEMLDSRTPVSPEHAFAGRNRAGIGNMLAGAISETLTQAGDMMGTDEIRSNIDDIAEGMITMLENVNRLVISVNDIVGGSEGYVTGSLANVYAMSDNFRAMSEELAAVSKELSGVARDPAQRERWERMLANAEETSANLARLSASLDNLAGDPALQQDIKDTVRLTKETLEETKNTVIQFQGTLDRTEELMDSADSLMGDAGDAIGEARQKMDQLNNVGDAIEIKMGLNVRAVDKNDDQQLNNDDIYVGDLNAAVGYEDTYVYFGADNIGEDNNFNLMMGYGSLAGFSFRGGVYRGELGLGAAYYDDFGAELTWYDTEDPKVNAYGYIPIADQLNLVVGGEDLGNDPVASLGIGVDLE